MDFLVRIKNFLMETITANPDLCVVFWIGVGGCVIALTIGYLCNDTGVYAALTAITGGGLCIATAFLTEGKKMVYGIVILSSWLIFAGFFYPILFGALILRRKIVERKKLRAETERTLQFTLPERENSYIRARLNTELNTARSLEEEVEKVSLEYARNLIIKLKNASLSKAERLETEEIEALFSLYTKKETWTAGDARTVNELFGTLLKLSAKYAL